MNKLLKISTLIAAALLSNVAVAQYRPKQVDTLVKNLQGKGIDTILIYMQGAVWPKPIKPGQPTCSCSKTLIYSVNLLYKDHGRFYKLNFSCCKETDTSRISKALSISYFLLQNQALIESKHYFAQQSKKYKRFPPPLPTDYPFEDVEFIVSKKNYSFELDAYKSTDGYKIWKAYPWIDKEIKLIKLIRQDLMITEPN